MTIITPIKYPIAIENAILSLSFQFLLSTMYPVNGSPKKGPMKANNNIPIVLPSATYLI